MKYILSFVFIVFILTGCTQKEQIVELKLPNLIGKPIVKEKQKNEEPIIDNIEPVVIEEENIPFLESQEQIKVAFVYPSKYVAKYAKPSISTIMGYLSYKKSNFKLKVIDSIDESFVNLQKVFDDLKEEGYKNVIALFTPNANLNLQQLILDDVRVYLPLIEKDETIEIKNNFIYGSISYKEQIEKLIDYSMNTKNVMFYQNSFLGKKLRNEFGNLGVDILVEKEIKKKRNYFRGLVKDYRLNNATVFLNTDIVKTSLLLSQMSAYSIAPQIVMSTQQNFDPKLISLTQVRDRDNFIVANSIDEVSDELLDEIATFGGNVKYEWVDYSVLVGINYLYDSNNSSLIKTQIEDRKVMYEPKLFKSTDSGFLEIK